MWLCRLGLVESYSTLWVSGSSAASLAHSSAISLPSIPWWLGHQRISIWMFRSLASRVVMCRLASRAYFCPGPGSSEVILTMAACASEKIVTAPIESSRVAAVGGPWREPRTRSRRLPGPAHVGLEAFPVVFFLPDRRVPCRTVPQTASVCEDGEAWSVEPCFPGHRGLFLEYDCSLQGGCLL